MVETLEKKIDLNITIATYNPKIEGDIIPFDSSEITKPYDLGKKDDSYNLSKLALKDQEYIRNSCKY